MSFLSSCSRTSLSIRFSQLLNDGAMFNANLVGFVLSCVYVSIFYHYVPPQEKSDHLLKIFGAAAFISLVIVYSKVHKLGCNLPKQFVTSSFTSLLARRPRQGWHTFRVHLVVYHVLHVRLAGAWNLRSFDEEMHPTYTTRHGRYRYDKSKRLFNDDEKISRQMKFYFHPFATPSVAIS